MWIELRLEQAQLGELQRPGQLGLPQLGRVTIAQGRDAEIHRDPHQECDAPVQDPQHQRIEQDVGKRGDHGCVVDRIELPHRRHRHEVHDRGQHQTEHSTGRQDARQQRWHAQGSPRAPSHEATQAVCEANGGHIEQRNLGNGAPERDVQRQDGVIDLAEAIDAPSKQLAGPVSE